MVSKVGTFETAPPLRPVRSYGTKFVSTASTDAPRKNASIRDPGLCTQHKSPPISTSITRQSHGCESMSGIFNPSATSSTFSNRAASPFLNMSAPIANPAPKQPATIGSDHFRTDVHIVRRLASSASTIGLPSSNLRDSIGGSSAVRAVHCVFVIFSSLWSIRPPCWLATHAGQREGQARQRVRTSQT